MGGLGRAENEAKGATDKTRFLEMDVFKGLLIVLVIVGHLIPQYDALVVSDGWRRVLMAIYGFHMQSFAFVAGFCSARLLDNSSLVELRAYFGKRAQRLLVPYVTWGLLYFALRFAVPKLAAVPYEMSRCWQFFIGYNPDGAMWFLWALFAAMSAVALGMRVLSLGRLVAVFAAVAALALWTQPWVGLPVAMNAWPLFALFFSAGLLLRRHYDAVKAFLGTTRWGWAAVVAWVALQLVQPALPILIPWYMLGLASVCGTAAFLFLSLRLAEGRLPVVRPLLFLSAYAMEIYILAEPVKVIFRTALVRMLGLPVAVSFPLMLLLMLTVPILLSRYAIRWKWGRLLLLGEPLGSKP